MRNRILLLILIFSLIVPACRKGEQDPALSLRSRKARLVNTWQLAQWDQLQTTSSGGSETSEETSFYGNTLNINMGSNTQTYSYSETFTIYKNGTFLRTFIIDGVTNTYTGSWWWTNSGKNKSMITFDNDQGSWAILELKNKEMILQQYTTNSDSDGYSTMFWCKKIYVSM
ncbi:MAG: hypothetical protein V2A54_07885 [Bacteroidota bacterium]